MNEDNKCKEMETSNIMLAISEKELARLRDIECKYNILLAKIKEQKRIIAKYEKQIDMYGLQG